MSKLRIDPALQHIANVYSDKVQKTVREATKVRINQDSLKLITNITEDMRAKIGELLREGEEQGRSVAATASKLLKTGLDKGVFRSARKRAYLIARTELHRARQRAAVDLYEAAGIELVTWIGISDDKICEVCKERDTKTYLLEEMKNKLPPVHPRCRCRLIPADFSLKIQKKRQTGKRPPTTYKYVIKLPKKIEKSGLFGNLVKARTEVKQHQRRTKRGYSTVKRHPRTYAESRKTPSRSITYYKFPPIEERLEQDKSPELKKAFRIAEAVRNAGGTALFVGGFIRDSIMGIPSKDIDVEVYGISKENPGGLLYVEGWHTF